MQRKWPDLESIKLIWHYLASDKEMVSLRSAGAISELINDTIRVIDEIESATDFPPHEDTHCDWCEYPDLCPTRKHFYMVEALPANEYLNEPGVVLVNKYAKLRDQEKELGDEIERVKEALQEYARNQGVTAIKGTAHKATVKFSEELKFPGKNEEGRPELESAIMEAGKWEEVSALDTKALVKLVKGGEWDKEVIDEVMKYGRIEETSMIRLSKLKEEE